MNSKQSVYQGIRIFIAALIALAVVLAAVPQPAAAQTTSDCAKKHTVVAGETLSSIALLYSVDYLDIAKANNMNDPYPVYVAQVLCIPGTTTTTTDTASTTSTSTKPALEVTYLNTVIKIATTKYPKNAIYSVRVADGTRYTADLDWNYVGLLRTNKDGVANKNFRLPASLKESDDLVVCLKNVRTNDVECYQITVMVWPMFGDGYFPEQ